MLRKQKICCTLGLLLFITAEMSAGVLSLQDDVGDASPRPMDPGPDLPFDTSAHGMPDLASISIEIWAPYDPVNDLFLGESDGQGHFLRVRLTFRGLLNPPGPVNPFEFQPFRYGDSPVYGFVEIDMDGDVDTGGELDAPQYRYLGNVVRFGGNVLRPEFLDRVAKDASAFDGDFVTPPYVERHGEEFHLALLGTQFSPAGVTEFDGDGDGVFESGETWHLRGSFFHRAHGYELFSFVEGGRRPGEYAPPSDLQFRHDAADDRTHVTLVFPLTNVGTGLMRGEPPEPTNHDPTDQASVLEALEDLQLSAFFLPILPTGLPEEAILINWAERNPQDHLDPAGWSATAIVGSSYTGSHPDGVFFLWTDVFPGVIAGDVDGSGNFDGRDRQLIAQHITLRDASDGVLDGIVTILDFAEDFSLYDVNHDGVVDGFDLAPESSNGDADQDGDVDLGDFAIFQRCFDHNGWPAGECQAVDLTRDLVVDLADLVAFNERMEGPGGK